MDGWVLRFLGGPSKRVNSVNVVYPSTRIFAEKIAECEKIFERQGLPVIFRLPDPFTPKELNHALDKAGYTQFDPTYVLGKTLVPGELMVHRDVNVSEIDLKDWLQLRADFAQQPLDQVRYLETILKIIVPEKVLVGCFVDDQPVTCGLAVLEGGLLGYFSIYTHPAARRRGYAGVVMDALTRWGMARGACFGYLQVEGDNEPALRLYKKLGFETCYRYVYWKKE
jgi:ribosomal protein S18 acetylase RimI-like enzyme